MTAKKQVRRRFTPEFKAEAVKLVLDEGLTQAQAARDLGVAESVLGRWIQAAREAQRPGALSADERAELKRLKQEVALLRKEREILKKAAAFFAKENL